MVRRMLAATPFTMIPKPPVQVDAVALWLLACTAKRRFQLLHCNYCACTDLTLLRTPRRQLLFAINLQSTARSSHKEIQLMVEAGSQSSCDPSARWHDMDLAQQPRERPS